MLDPVWLFSILATIYFLLSEWSMAKEVGRWLWRMLWITFWHWIATWSVDALFSIGWGLMLGSGEYFLSLCFLGLATLATVSVVVHKNGRTGLQKTSGVVIAACLCALMALVTLANKGEKEWSHIPDFLASRIPLPDDPKRDFPSPVAPQQLERTSSEELARMQREIGAEVPKRSAPIPAPSPAIEGTVEVWVMTGDDKALNPVLEQNQELIGTLPPEVTCSAQFTCYSEDQVKTAPVDLDFTVKKRRRIFFAVANTSLALIQKPVVHVTVNANDSATVKGMSLYKPNQAHDDLQHLSVEYGQNETTDIVPYTISSTPNGYVADLEVGDSTLPYLQLVFRIFAANLKVRVVVVTLHIIRA